MTTIQLTKSKGYHLIHQYHLFFRPPSQVSQVIPHAPISGILYSKRIQFIIMHRIWLSYQFNFLSWNSSLYFTFMNFITLNILGQLFCSLEFNQIYLKWSHDEFKLCIFDRLITEVMLHSSDYILSDGAIFQFIPLPMVFTLII